MPAELDLFIATMSRNPLPSGRSLAPDCAIGRPNRHWLSRLPSKAKSWKSREDVAKYLQESEAAKQFRAFYEDLPLQFQFDGIHDSFQEAQ